MLARSREIRLGNGIELSTPLLIPSLSSGALGPLPHQDSPRGTPDLKPCSIVHSQHLIGAIDETLLISAYDIAHGLLADREAFRTAFKQSRYAQPRVLFIDSGWYEKNGGPQGSAFAVGLGESRPWEEADYKRTIDALDEELTPVVVSWDHVGSYKDQIGRAQAFFGDRHHLASDLLFKPPPGSRFHNFNKLTFEDITTLRAFDIIGITERELGESLLNRLVNIAKLRQLLDQAQVSVPVHIFGGLDPLCTPLYFAAGAEIFDGLGWLRYTYREGVAMHWSTAILLDGQINMRSVQAQLWASLRNLEEINRLSDEMRRFSLRKGDWEVFHRDGVLKPIFESLEEKLEAWHGR